jgi:hypothetical protein
MFVFRSGDRTAVFAGGPFVVSLHDASFSIAGAILLIFERVAPLARGMFVRAITSFLIQFEDDSLLAIFWLRTCGSEHAQNLSPCKR